MASTQVDQSPLDVLPRDFWDRVRYSPGCWEWIGAACRGYGVFRKTFGETRAHRISLAASEGPIPDGLMALHSCDNPSCVNPDHLRAGTHLENVKDCKERGSRWVQRGNKERRGGRRAGAGRPPSRGTAAKIRLPVCFTDAEREELRRVEAHHGKSASRVIRDLVSEEAARILFESDPESSD